MAPYERRPSWSRTTSVPGTTRNPTSHGRPARHCRGGAFGVSGQQREGREYAAGLGRGRRRRRRGPRRSRGLRGRRRLARRLPGRCGPDLLLGVVHRGRRGIAAAGAGGAARTISRAAVRVAGPVAFVAFRRPVGCGAGRAATHRLDHHDVRGALVSRVAGLGLAVRAAAATQRVGERSRGHGSDGTAERQGCCDERDAVRPAVTRSAPGTAHLGCLQCRGWQRSAQKIGDLVRFCPIGAFSGQVPPGAHAGGPPGCSGVGGTG